MRNIALAAFAFALLAVRPAHACGAWSMHDNARHRLIAWEPLYVNVYYDVTNGKRLAQAEADYDNGVITITNEHGHTLGSSRANTSDYDIRVSPNGKEQLDDHHSWYWFDVTVTHGGETIITSDDAVGLCGMTTKPGPSAREHQRQEIEARVRAYLDWRDKL